MNALGKQLAEEAQKIRLKEKYVEFLKAPIPELIENHEIEGVKVAIRVFSFNAKEDTGFDFEISDEDKFIDTLKICSVAKVLAAGPDSIYKTGDIVKLNDYETATIDNPVYEKYKQAMANRPMNSKAIDAKEPHVRINNLLHYYQSNMFVINPIKMDNDPLDYFTFLVTDGNISHKIKDPYAFVA